MVEFTPHLKRQLRRFNPQDDVPVTDERCGIVVRDYRFGPHLIEIPNRHETPSLHFAIWRSDLDPVTQNGNPILAVLHTHVSSKDSKPSAHDFAQIKMLRRDLLEIVGIVYVVPLGLLIEYSETAVTRRLLLPDRKTEDE